MKKTLIVSLLAVAMGGSLQAGSVSFTNIGGNPVVDNTGAPIAGLFSAVVTFDGAVPSDEASLRASTGAVINGMNQTAAIPSGADGSFNNSGSYTLDAGGANQGSTLYLLLASGSDLATADFVGLIDTGLTIDADTPAPDSNTFILNNSGTPIVGDFTASNVTADWSSLGGGSDYMAIGYELVGAPIPEPSSTLLAALAGLGLIARRRR